MRLLIYSALSLFFFQPVYAQFGGELDTTFHHDGLAESNIGIGYDVCWDLAIQPDGKILAAGGSSMIAGTETDFSFVRFLSDGNPDTTFGTGGTVTTDFSMLYDLANAMYLMPDGRFLAAGYTGGDWGVARYLPNGELDTTFSGDGKFSFDFDGENDQATGIGMQSDGKIIVGGFATIDGFFARFAVARLLDNGTLDPSFGTGGYTSAITFGNWDQSYACLVRPDDKIILAGYSSDELFNYDYTVMQFDANGILDPAFGTGGIVRTDFDGANDYAGCALLQTDGKIIVGGGTGATPDQHLALVRYNTDGSIDPTFGVDGKVVMDIDPSLDEFATSITAESDQKIVVGGTVGLYAVGYDFLVVKLLPNGLPDNTFSDDGIITTHLSDDWDIVYATGVQSDGKIIAGGFMDKFGDNEYAMVRYLNSGTFVCDSIILQPEDILLPAGAFAQFIVADAFGSAEFQWQVNEGTGWSDLTDGGFYSGTNNDTLVINPVGPTLNENLYRCIMSDFGCTDTSDAALLNVTSMVVENEWLNTVSISPNPVVSGSIEINYPAELNIGRIEITNMLGSMVREIVNPKPGMHISIDDLQNGSYMIRFEYDGQILSKPFICLH